MINHGPEAFAYQMRNIINIAFAYIYIFKLHLKGNKNTSIIVKLGYFIQVVY